MREIGITFIALGAIASLSVVFAPTEWELDRWGSALLMLGTPLFMLDRWIQHKRELLLQNHQVSPPEGISERSPLTLPSESTDPE